MPGLLEAIRRANRTRAPEDSVPLRAAVLGAVMTGGVALAIEQAISIVTAVGVLTLMPLAYWLSYRRRREDNWHIKLALTVAAIIGLMRFFGQLSAIATLDEVRFPLADLFLWVQVIHSFDLPARKDLNFSLGASLTLMAVAGSISQDMRFLAPLLVYLGCAAAALILSYRSEISDTAQGWARVERQEGQPAPARWREPVRAFALTLAVAAALFMVVPRPQGTRTFALPFSLGSGIGSQGLGGIVNPGFSGDPAARSNLAAYYGFGSQVDLRVRGDLPDELVMRVRGSAPAMRRALAFDRYDGTRWSLPEGDPTPLAGDPPYVYPIEFRSLGPRQQVIETYYIEREQANVLFSGGQPDAVWFDGTVNIDALGSLSLDSTLTEGTVYSVSATRGAADPDDLRQIEIRPNARFERYLQLPDELPDRVRRLAERITATAPSAYDKVKAIEGWLADNYRYRIDSPVPPEGQDAVDHFLFDTDVGFCEQFASATAIMLRSLGIPARVVVGFTPGNRSAFTGYYEVNASDAHMWVEVWFDRYGWYEFDPTFAIPPAEFDLGEVVPLVKAIGWAIEKVSALLPDGVGGVVGTAMVVLLIGTVLGGAYIAYRKLYRPRVRGPSVATAELGPVGRAFVRFEERFDGGRARRADETASEFMARSLGPLQPSSESALRAFEKERYSHRGPSRDETRAAIAELERLANLVTTAPD